MAAAHGDHSRPGFRRGDHGRRSGDRGGGSDQPPAPAIADREAAEIDILYAAEYLLPATGGAERFALEWLGELAARHRIRAAWLDQGDDAPAPADAVRCRPAWLEPIAVSPPLPAGGYWRCKRRRREALGEAIRTALSQRTPDVVVTALHVAPAAIAASRAAGRPAVLHLHSYESLCKYAFDVGSRCRPASACRDCPRAAALEPAEHRELLGARAANQRALAEADRLIAPSGAVGEACASWCGRRPAIVPSVTSTAPPLEERRGGPILLASARWSPNKGLALLAPLARALAPRPMLITSRGLPDPVRARLERSRHVEVVPNAPVRSLLSAASLLLVPSQWAEPFGRLAFEGLAAGVPTLAAGVGGMTEFVPKGQLVEPPDSVAAWVEAVDALEDPGRRRAARREGFAAARRVVAVPPAERLEAVLRDVVTA